MSEYLGSKGNKANRIDNDGQSRIIIVAADIDEETFVLINLYNANTETEQIKAICELSQLLGNFFLDSKKNIALAADFNLYFDPSLVTLGGKPALRKISISKLAQIFEQKDLVDI